MTLDWERQNPCSFKFRKSFFYQDEGNLMHNVSPMKYLPERKQTDLTRFKKYGIGIGLGKRNFSEQKKSPGPGDYNLPSLFNKGKQGKYPMN